MTYSFEKQSMLNPLTYHTFEYTQFHKYYLFSSLSDSSTSKLLQFIL